MANQIDSKSGPAALFSSLVVSFVSFLTLLPTFHMVPCPLHCTGKSAESSNHVVSLVVFGIVLRSCLQLLHLSTKHSQSCSQRIRAFVGCMHESYYCTLER